MTAAGAPRPAPPEPAGPGRPRPWDREPGLPRFARLAVALAALAALWVVLRPLDARSSAPGGGTRPAAGASPSGGTLFLRESCGACHVTVGPSSALGPSLAGVLSAGAARIADPTYTGFARSPRDYVREATLDHCVDVRPGYAYDCREVVDVGLRLSEAEVDRLVDFLCALPAPVAP